MPALPDCPRSAGFHGSASASPHAAPPPKTPDSARTPPVLLEALGYYTRPISVHIQGDPARYRWRSCPRVVELGEGVVAFKQDRIFPPQILKSPSILQF